MKKLDRALTLRTEESVSYIIKMTSFSWEVGALESDLGEFISSLLAICWLLFVCVYLFFGLLFWLAMKWISHLAAEVDPGWLKPIYSCFQLFPRWACGLIQATERGRDSFAAWRMKGVRLRTSAAMRKPENKLPRPFREPEWISFRSLRKELAIANTLDLAFKKNLESDLVTPLWAPDLQYCLGLLFGAITFMITSFSAKESASEPQLFPVFRE